MHHGVANRESITEAVERSVASPLQRGSLSSSRKRERETEREREREREREGERERERF